MHGGDRGATMVEAALVLPILVFLLFGIIELGGALRAYSTTADAVRSGGRAASLAGADPMADAIILEDIAAAHAAGGGEVELVVIWHAAVAGEPVPAACIPASIGSTPNSSSVGVPDAGGDTTGACNVYIRPQAADGAFQLVAGEGDEPPEYYFACEGVDDPDADAKLDCNWPGKERRVLTSPREATVQKATDLVGVYVRSRHDYYTGFLGSSLTVTDQSVSLIEPQGYELS